MNQVTVLNSLVIYFDSLLRCLKLLSGYLLQRLADESQRFETFVFSTLFSGDPLLKSSLQLLGLRDQMVCQRKGSLMVLHDRVAEDGLCAILDASFELLCDLVDGNSW